MTTTLIKLTNIKHDNKKQFLMIIGPGLSIMSLDSGGTVISTPGGPILVEETPDQIVTLIREAEAVQHNG